MLAVTLLMILGITLGACFGGSPNQSYSSNSYADPPPFYSEAVYGGQPQVRGHPYRCPDCGWFSWGER
jgi:hypothetical protein